MSHFEVISFSIGLALLVLLSAFFSISETALMVVNRYRIRHQAKLKKRYAMLILQLLKHPDRLLGTVLIGNNLANIVASSIATFLAMHFWGDKGVVIVTIVLTIVILMFAEIAPKTLAALYSESVARFVAWPVYWLLQLFYPLVWLANSSVTGLLKMVGIKLQGSQVESFSREELRSIVYDMTGRMSRRYQHMLLGILDLNKVSVDDVIIPCHEIIGIDLNASWDTIQQQITTSQYDWLPVYRETINNVVGVLHLRELMGVVFADRKLNKEILLEKLHEPYFVPEGTALNVQLVNFQQQRKRIALVVDEYGEVKGLITLADILEEIVGEFTTTVSVANKAERFPDGSFLVDGSINLRELNRLTGWKFPLQGPRTLNGLIIEYLEAMPYSGSCVCIADYPIEIIQVKENRVHQARVFPKLVSE